MDREDDREDRPSFTKRLPGSVLGVLLTILGWSALDASGFFPKLLVAFVGFGIGHGVVAGFRRAGSRGAPAIRAARKAAPVSDRPALPGWLMALPAIVVLLMAGVWIWGVVRDKSEARESEARSREGAPVAEAPTADGTTYIAVAGVGVVRLRNRALSVVHASTADLRALEVGSDGAAYVLAGTDLVRIDDAGAKTIASGLSSSAKQIAIARDGSVYVAEPNELKRVSSDKQQRAVGVIPPPAENRPCNEIGLDTDDVLYCSAIDFKAPTPRVIHRRVGDKWEDLPLPPLPPTVTFSSVGPIQLAPDGRLVFGTPEGFLVLGSDRRFTPLAPEDGGVQKLGSMRVTRGGDAFVWAEPRPFTLLRDGTWRPVYRSSEVSVSPVPAIDGLGRLWFVPKVGGFGVLPPDAAAITWPECSKYGAVVDLAVIGNGPELPAELPRPIRGPVRGQLTKKKKPLAGTKVMLMSSHALAAQRASEGCEIHAASDLAGLGVTEGVAQTATSSDGRFSFSDIPRGPGALIVMTAEQTPISELMAPGLHCCEQMKDKTGLDLGTIELPEI